MRLRLFFLVNLLLFGARCVSQEVFVDFKGSEVFLQKGKSQIMVCLSSASCHQCYIELHDFLKKQNVFERQDLNFVVLCFLDEKQIKDIVVRKNLYEVARNYFPETEQVYFTAIRSIKKIKFRKYKLDARKFPCVFILDKNGRMKFFEDYREFISEYI